MNYLHNKVTLFSMRDFNTGKIMKKTPRITIKPLTHEEMKLLLADTLYKHFFPVRCSRCGIKHNFNRRIFHITGVPKNKRADDETQNWLQYHFLQYHKIQYVFFREYSKKFYVDSASCPSCNSTAIVFDMDHDYVMAEYAKMAEGNIIQFKEKN